MDDFTVINDQVYLLSHKEGGGFDPEQDAVEFFSKMLRQHGICCVLSINKLFELKLKSSPAIQEISGSNINQFSSFLMKYPQEFLVTNDNVIARKKLPKLSYSGKSENKRFPDPLSLEILNFLKAYTSNKSLFHIDYLYNNVGRFFLYNNGTPVFPSRSDLLFFLGLYPHIFFVDNSRIVNIIASGRKASVCSSKKRQFGCRRENISMTKEEEISKPRPFVSKLKILRNLSLTPLDTDMKLLSDRIKEKISKKKAAAKYVTPNQSKEGLVVEPSFRKESKLPKNDDQEKEAAFNSSNSLELENQLLDYQYSPCWRNDCEGEFIPSKIEEIENNIFSNLICDFKKNCDISKNNELTASHSGKIINHSFQYTVSSSFPKDFGGRENFDRSTTEALLFLNDKLWGEEGNLKIIKIEELFSIFSQSLEMCNFCCKSLDEFKDFLCKFPNHFIISQNKVMARKNKVQEVSALLNNEGESIPQMVFHFLNLFTKQFDFILLKKLFGKVGKYFRNINKSPFFKSPRDLVSFMEMFPEVFHIDNGQITNLNVSKENVYHEVKFNSGVVKTDSFLDPKLCSTVIEETYPNVPESIELWEDHVLKKTKVIEDLSQCRVVTEEILNSQKFIALDCEGVNLGAAGRLTLVQIALANGQVYIFDIIKAASMVNEGGLKDILESESIIKVIHDSSNDAANLYTEYGVKIRQIFDTRAAHHLIVNEGGDDKKILNRLTAIGFNELCSKYGANFNVLKDETKNVYKCDPSYWMDRPLTKDMLAYAALDVASLVPQIFFKMLKQLKGISEKLLWELSGKHSLSILINKELLFD